MNKIEFYLLKMQFNEKQRLSTYRKLVKFMNNGVALTHALDTMYAYASEEGRKPKTPQAMAINAWRARVKEGKPFGESVRGWVPEADVTVILSGEKAGNLIVALENAIFLQQGSKKIKTALIKGLSYPFLLFSVALGFLVLAANNILPAFAEVYPPERWVGAGASMAFIANWVNTLIIPFVISAAIATAVLIYALPRWTGAIRAKLDGYPPFSIYRLSVGAGFLLSMAAMVRAGVAIPQALQLIRQSAMPWYKERLTATLRQMGNGKNFGEALYQTKLHFPEKEAVADLRAYASLKGFDETLQMLGAEWMDESVERIEGQTGILKNVALVMMGGVFMWIASGIFSLQQQIASGL
jgi:type II secretory pathway component PulF